MSDANDKRDWLKTLLITLAVVWIGGSAHTVWN